MFNEMIWLKFDYVICMIGICMYKKKINVNF